MKDVLEYTEDELTQLDVETLLALRHEAESKQTLYNTEQMVLKINMNSLYGALGNQWFPLFNEAMANAITGNGRYFIQMLARNVEKKLQNIIPSNKNYVIYSDTDSIYFQINNFMSEFVQNNNNIDEQVDFANQIEIEHIQPVIKETVDIFTKQLNACNKSVIWAEREIIADAAVFTTKKKYFARVRDSEGVRFPANSPKIKVMGLEIAKSSTPPWVKKKLKEAIPLILDKDFNDLKTWVDDIKDEYKKTHPWELASVSSVSNLAYTLGEKGIPMGSRAAIVYNEYVKKEKLQLKYTLISPGDKTKRLFLTEPNPFKSNIIAFVSEDFVNELVDYIDYDTTFEKTFINPLNLMITAIGWDIENQMQQEEW
jgi:DNA polymerase elongation subunit (family B)